MFSRKKLVQIMPIISTMHQCGVISSAEKNNLIKSMNVSESYFEVELTNILAQRDTAAGYFDTIISILEGGTTNGN